MPTALVDEPGATAAGHAAAVEPATPRANSRSGFTLAAAVLGFVVAAAVAVAAAFTGLVLRSPPRYTETVSVERTGV